MGRIELQLIIFDCDGVLVDSEAIATGLLHEIIVRLGRPVSAEAVVSRFLGQTERATHDILAAEFGVVISDSERSHWRALLIDRFELSLRPIDGIAEAVAALTIPKCVASSSSPARIRASLEMTGLLSLFEPHLYSGVSVPRGKPAPDLFLHAAAEMAVQPDMAIVIEDSPAGIAAAKAAGMGVLAFVGGSHLKGGALRSEIESLNPDAIFDDMRNLAGLVAQCRACNPCGKRDP